VLSHNCEIGHEIEKRVLIKPLSFLYNIVDCMNIEEEERGEE
jgi:hypothetical protein